MVNKTSTVARPHRYMHLIDAALSLREAGELQDSLNILVRAREEAPADPQVLLLVGIAYQEVGRFTDAEASIRQALKLDPEYPDALQALGLLLSTKDRPDEAVGVLRSHLLHAPADVTSLKALAAVLSRQGKRDDAVHVFSQAWEQTRAHDVGLELGRFLMRLRRLDDAEGVLRQLSNEGESADVLVEQSALLVMRKRSDEAVDALQQALALDPTYDRAWRELAYCYQQMGSDEKALDAAERAVALNNRDYRNWRIMTRVLLETGRDQEALEAARQGIQLADPDDPDAGSTFREFLLHEAVALVNTGQMDEALVCFDAARDRFPADEVFVNLQTFLLLVANRPEQAMKVLDEAAEAGIPPDGALAPIRYQVLHELGRPDEAWAAIEPTLSTQTEKRLHLLADRGVMVYTKGNVEAARAIFQQLSGYAPDQPRPSCNLGFVLTGMGDLSGAEEYLLKALDAPDDTATEPMILADLGYLYLLTGEFARAEEYLHRAESVAEEDTAILRVAGWRHGRVIPDGVPHPTRSVSIAVAAHANLVTHALAEGRSAAAESLTQSMIRQHPDDPWGHAMLGWVELASGDPAAAREAWQEALARTDDPQDRQALSGRLESLPT